MPDSIAIPKDEFWQLYRKIKGEFAQVERIALRCGLIQPKDALLTHSESSDMR